jgi:hypothetical protein
LVIWSVCTRPSTVGEPMVVTFVVAPGTTDCTAVVASVWSGATCRSR